MAYVKHPVHGNNTVDDSEVPALVSVGWTKWPRTAEEKALGDGSDAAYWRKKYERDVAVESTGFEETEDAPKRRGRPPRE